MPDRYIVTCADTQIAQAAPWANYARCKSMSIGRSTRGGAYRALLRFPIEGQYPPGATITAAELRLWPEAVYSSTGNEQFSIHRVIEPWFARRVNWCNQPLYEPTSAATFTVPAAPGNVITADLTTLVQDWFSRAHYNAGILIKAMSPISRGVYIRLSSRNSRNSDRWPRLFTTFTLPAVAIGTIQPTFVNEAVSLLIPPTGTVDHLRDNSLLNTLTILITNQGPGTVVATLQISADGIHFTNDGAPQTLVNGNTTWMVPQVFARYTRLVVQETSNLGADVDLTYQGLIG